MELHNSDQSKSSRNVDVISKQAFEHMQSQLFKIISYIIFILGLYLNILVYIIKTFSVTLKHNENDFLTSRVRQPLFRLHVVDNEFKYYSVYFGKKY
jgi:hypothetical protein